MKINIEKEIVFITYRSSGSGGQNVNKVETAVEGRWNFQESELINQLQKSKISTTLANRIIQNELLIVRSQKHRTQLANKKEVIEKMHEMIGKALEKKKSRIATKPTNASKLKRLDEKKKQSALKEQRKKWR